MVNNQIRSYESDDKSNSLRKEYMVLEKKYISLKREAESLEEELNIANLDPKEAHAKFVARINNFKQGTKSLEEKQGSLREELASLRRTLDQLTSPTVQEELTPEELEKYELLKKREQEMTAFMSSFDDTCQNVVREQKEAQFMIVALLEHIGKGLDDSNNMPTQDMKNEMESMKEFKEKNLQTAQRTMENLKNEKKKREQELELLRSSESALQKQYQETSEDIENKKHEIELFQDLDRVRREFDDTKTKLMKLRNDYIRRRDTMRQQIQALSAEHEKLKEKLQHHEIGKELEEMENAMRFHESTIFDLKEFVDSKMRETDYELVKVDCLRVVDQLNGTNIRAAQQVNTQAKLGW
jgi:intraflagellar transport protein 74